MTLSQQFDAKLRSEGLWSAMRWVNAQVPYRFTAIFRFDGDMLRNVYLVDKLNPEITSCADQPIADSYCIYIRRASKTFSVEQALTDVRVADHPKRQSYQCYYGIPLFDRENRMLGTVCHFDTEPIRVTETVVSTLEVLGPSISEAAFQRSS